jgi:hypothetical protein
MHLQPVREYEESLLHGGVHRFEITADELPELATADQMKVPCGVRIPCKETSTKNGSVWAHIVSAMAIRDTVCIYKRFGEDTYEVLCFIPPPKRKRRIHDWPKGGSELPP